MLAKAVHGHTAQRACRVAHHGTHTVTRRPCSQPVPAIKRQGARTDLWSRHVSTQACGQSCKYTSQTVGMRSATCGSQAGLLMPHCTRTGHSTMLAGWRKACAHLAAQTGRLLRAWARTPSLGHWRQPAHHCNACTTCSYHAGTCAGALTSPVRNHHRAQQPVRSDRLATVSGYVADGQCRSTAEKWSTKGPTLNSTRTHGQ